MAALQKAPFAGAFLFLGLSLALAGAPTLAAPCQPPSPGEPVRVEQVFDGDTLRLTDDRRVRLIGINTPEMGRDGEPDQPLARAARQATQRFVERARTLTLHLGQEPRDRYGRTLAHLYNGAGDSLEAQLLRQGMGFYIGIPPNLAQRECLQAAEAEARQAGRGVWGQAGYRPLRAAALEKDQGGFQRVQGRVSATGRTRSGPYLELDDRLFIRVRREHLSLFPRSDFSALQGQTVEVRGWIIPRNLSASQRQRGYQPFMLELSHPDQLSPADIR